MIVKKKLAPKDFRPKRILAGKDESVVLGTIYGIATGIATTVTEKDELLEGLRGQFRFIDADGSQSSAYVLWFPSGMGTDLIDAAREPGSHVQFAMRVIVERADNPAGYSWGLENLGEVSKADPLEALISHALEKNVTAVDAVSPGKGKGKEKQLA